MNSESSSAGSPKLIVVTGDPVNDHNLYQGNRATADSPAHRGFSMSTTAGGALLLCDLINRVIGESPTWQVSFGLDVKAKALPQEYHAYCLWDPQVSNPGEKDEKKHHKVWRAVEPPLGYGQPDLEPVNEAECIAFRAQRKEALGKRLPLPQPDIVVIDDAGLDFRNEDSRDRWPIDPNHRGEFCPSWVVMKVSGPIGQGALWKEITEHCSENLIVIISADQLRRGNVRLSRALSWEATVEDLRHELETNFELAPLRLAKHLIVTFRSDGAFWLERNTQQDSALLVFDGTCAEGDWAAEQGEGGVFGYLSCFTAAVVHVLSQADSGCVPDFESALSIGLGASRKLRQLGHGPVDDAGAATPGFPYQEIAEQIRDSKEKFVSARLPAKQTHRGTWMILDEWQVQAQAVKQPRPHFGAAFITAILGPEALARFPIASFGGLLTVERQEIESLRTLRHLIQSYKRDRSANKPLNLGVFGPPGAGKSFGVKQIAKAVLGKGVEILTFNLSQFDAPDSLIGALHQVRDKVLAGGIPVIFWDEFDSCEYKWLQYLLAPMQDGNFQDGQITHPIGKCLFIFAGATSPTYETFGPPDPKYIAQPDFKAQEKWHQFVLAKGPDFRSRLVTYLNVLGPNIRETYDLIDGQRQWRPDPTDIYYPVRRAFFIRSKFDLKSSEGLQIDPGVLQALLEVPRYKAGARSLEFLCEHLQSQAKLSKGIPRRSQLPGQQLLNMHVDADAFWKLCERETKFQGSANKLAVLLHEAYRIRIKGRAEKRALDVPFDQLSTDMQSSNLAQAQRIPQNLELAGLQLVAGDIVPFEQLVTEREKHPEEKELHELLRQESTLEILAEAEHNGWMVERMLQGHRYARISKPDPEKKLHPLLVPYNQLSEADKAYDRETITGNTPPADKPHLETFGYIDIVKTAGFRVVKIPNES